MSSCCTATPPDGGCRDGMTDDRTSAYVELHCHSAFSLLDGAALPELLIARAADLGYHALALTDHDELGGAVRFAQAGEELGVQAIIGAEITFSAAATPRKGFSAGASRPIRGSSMEHPQIRAGAAENNIRPEGSAENVLRLLESPEHVDVDHDESPRRIFWRGRAIPVISTIGPERLSGDWWNDGYSRDYWRCESGEECGELVLYRDAAGWWVQGWYD